MHEVLIRIPNRLQKSSPFLTHSPIYSRHRKSAKKNWFVSSASFDVKERLDFQLSSSFLFFFTPSSYVRNYFLFIGRKRVPAAGSVRDRTMAEASRLAVPVNECSIEVDTRGVILFLSPSAAVVAEGFHCLLND